MTLHRRRVGLGVLAFAALARAQDLAPRAYVIAPVGENAVTLSDTYSTGSVFVDPSVTIQNVNARFHTTAISYYVFDLLGRSANITLRALCCGEPSPAFNYPQVEDTAEGSANIALRLSPKGLPPQIE